MNFSDFLNESYKKEISLEEAKSLLTTYCYNMDFEKPLWRGMKKSANILKIEGALGGRSSVKGSKGNYYTLLIDKYAEHGTPLRSKSIICATYQNKTYTNIYGDRYAVFPYNDINIAVTDKDAYDIWDTTSNNKFTMTQFNNVLHDLEISDKSVSDIVSGIELHIGNNRFLSTIFNKKSSIESQLASMFTQKSLNYDVVKNDSPRLLAFKNEAWVSGKCIVISEEVWKQLVTEEFKLK